MVAQRRFCQTIIWTNLSHTTNNEINENPLEESPVKRHHRKPEKERGKFFLLRQILNIVFMLVAVAGCVVYVKVDNRMGAVIIIIGMAFKMAECALRFKK